MDKFSFRIGDMEVRSCGDFLLSGGEHVRAEIIVWQRDGKEFCYTIAYWKKTKESYDLLFVGDRPFRANKDIFWKLAEQGQEMLGRKNER
ncbi:MAG: hypothetical protein IPJ03_16760 [Ignavibacteriales bacterium]|nr:hypothetical protein [Ignavibacteriales bacterium]